MVRKNKDVVSAGCMRDVDVVVVVDGERIMEIWKRYYEKLMNEQFDWDKDNLEGVRPVSGPCEIISTSDVGAAIANLKSAGPSGVVVEMLKASWEAGTLWGTDVCNEIVREGCIPDDWLRSWIVNVCKCKGDDLNVFRIML